MASSLAVAGDGHELLHIAVESVGEAFDGAAFQQIDVGAIDLGPAGTEDRRDIRLAEVKAEYGLLRQLGTMALVEGGEQEAGQPGAEIIEGHRFELVGGVAESGHQIGDDRPGDPRAFGQQVLEGAAADDKAARLDGGGGIGRAAVIVEHAHFADDAAGSGVAQGEFAPAAGIEAEPDSPGCNDDEKVRWITALEQQCSRWPRHGCGNRRKRLDVGGPGARQEGAGAEQRVDVFRSGHIGCRTSSPND